MTSVTVMLCKYWANLIISKLKGTAGYVRRSVLSVVRCKSQVM